MKGTRAPQRLVLLTLAHRSGMGRVAASLAEAAYQQSPDSVLIAPPMEAEPANIRRLCLNRPEPGRGLMLHLLSLAGLAFEAAWVGWRVARRGDVFLMIDLSSTMPLCLLPLVAARLRGAVTVLNLHDFYPHALRFPRPLQPLERWLYRFAYRRFHLVAPMTDRQVSQLVGEAGCAANRIILFRHGVLPLEYVPVPVCARAEARLLIFGSLRSNKNIFESIGAVVQLREQGHKVVLRIAGAPRRQELDYWRRCRARADGVAGIEIVEGFVQEEALAVLLKDVDAIICPYSDFSSQSGVAMLALSNGIPLVATPDGGAGWLAEAQAAISPVTAPVTASSVAKAISAFLAVPRAERLMLAAAAQKALVERGEWEANIERLLRHVRQDEPAASALHAG